jgi:crotonobetainyl-CoA:carnitine CoA-transferase CaiB-like acyl-CoA transferase
MDRTERIAMGVAVGAWLAAMVGFIGIVAELLAR